MGSAYKPELTEYKCPRCGKPLCVFASVAVWCSSYGEDIPGIKYPPEEETWENKYPDACGYLLMSG